MFTFFRRRLRMDRFARFFASPLHKITTITIPFAHHPIFRFYSAENFSRFLKEVSQADINAHYGNNRPREEPKSVQAHSYWTCKVEKVSKNRSGPNFDQVVFYHLNRESLVYLMNRVLSILTISIEQLMFHDNNWLSLRQILLTKGFARIVQIDLEKECFHVEIPEILAPAAANGNLVLLVTDNTYDPDEQID